MSTALTLTESIDQAAQGSGIIFANVATNITRIQIGPVGIDTYSENALVEEILEHALSGRSTHQVVTVNAQFYVLAEHSPDFRRCLEKAEYSCADGMPIAWACRQFAGLNVPRIAGVSLIEQVCERGANRGLRVFFLGGKPGAARETARLLRKRYPGLVVVGTASPEIGLTQTDSDKTIRASIIEEIESAKPHVVFLGLGAPKQEIFADKYLRPLRVPIVMGVGGSFEILSGMMPRAPRWLQTSGFEWLYRLAQEPKRMWRRYLIGNSEFLWSLAKWRLEQIRP
jgi:N-acetylglucosaminyldiphosphoundecaprenol N-acetyl-beta-D-mannosaminyltransferase